MAANLFNPRRPETDGVPHLSSACMSTIHASTSSQPVLDGYSKKDWRSGRGVGGNIIPTTTGAAKAIKLVLPRLAGKFNGASPPSLRYT